jgi:hypothetical protein
VLEKAGVDVKIDLTRVGENLQEHVIMGGIVFRASNVPGCLFVFSF